MKFFLEAPDPGHREVARLKWSPQQYIQAYNIYGLSYLSDEFLVSFHAVHHKLQKILQKRCIISWERRDTFQRKYPPTPSEVLFNICDRRFHILFWKHGPTKLVTLQLYLRKCCLKIYIRRLYIVVLKLEILLNPLYRFLWVARNTQHVVDASKDIIIILEVVRIHCWP